jgi:hypothetical protein
LLDPSEKMLFEVASAASKAEAREKRAIWRLECKEVRAAACAGLASEVAAPAIMDAPEVIVGPQN